MPIRPCESYEGPVSRQGPYRSAGNAKVRGTLHGNDAAVFPYECQLNHVVSRGP